MRERVQQSLFKLFETLRDDGERAGSIKRSLVGKLCIERRGFAGWGARWRRIAAIET